MSRNEDEDSANFFTYVHVTNLKMLKTVNVDENQLLIVHKIIDTKKVYGDVLVRNLRKEAEKGTSVDIKE